MDTANLDNTSTISAPLLTTEKNSLLHRMMPYLVLVVLTVLFYFPLVLPGMGNQQENDFAIFHVPFRIYMADQLHDGSMPFRANQLWGGYPAYQDPQFGMWFPLNLLFAAIFPNFGTETVIDLYVLATVLLLAIGSVFFIRSAGLSRLASIVGAIIICFNGFTITHLVYINMIQTFGLSLLAAGFLMRFARGGAVDLRLPLGATVALACSNLAGHPQITVYYHYGIATGVAVLSFWLWWRTGRLVTGVRMAAAGIFAFTLGITIAAVQFIPSAYLIEISPRASIGEEEVLWSAIGLRQMPMFLFPGFYHTLPWHLEIPPYYFSNAVEGRHPFVAFTNSTEGYVPIGVMAVVLGLTGWIHYRKNVLVQVLGFGSIFLMACAVGQSLPVYWVLTKVLPGIGMQRVATRILVLFMPVWALLAALGFEAFYRRQPGASLAGRVAAIALLTVVAVWTFGAFAWAKWNWVNAWFSLFNPYVKGSLDLNFLLALKEPLMTALRTQIYWGLFMLASVVLLFIVLKRWTRIQYIAVLCLLMLELTLYSFGWTLSINRPHLDGVKSVELATFSSDPEGRFLSEPDSHRTKINAILTSEHQTVNGYIALVDKWAAYMMPPTMPPWDLAIHKAMCDLWNISDICVLKHPTIATLDGQPHPTSGWGWVSVGQPPPPDYGVELDIPRLSMPTSMTLDMKTTGPVSKLHLLAFSGQSSHLPDGTEIGRVTITTEAGTTAVTELLLGQHISDSLWSDDQKTSAMHSKVDVAFIRPSRVPGTPAVAVYDAQLDVQTTSPITSVHLEATGPFPATLSTVSAIAELDDGTSAPTYSFETQNYYQTPSRDPAYFTLRHKNPPGFIRVVPSAVRGSYKKIEYMLKRLTDGSMDPLNQVVVDKRQVDETELAALNAPDPDNFSSTATITWTDDENAVIHAEANQPGWLFLSYQYDKAWSATLNGEEISVYRGSGAFMTIPVPAGKSEIVMKYSPPGLLAGSVVSIASLMLLAGCWIYAVRLRRKGKLG